MVINGQLWHVAKDACGSRSGRKRGSKFRIARSGQLRTNNIRAKTRIMERYLTMLNDDVAK